MCRVVVVYSRSRSGFLLGGSWCGYAFVVLSWGAKCGWGVGCFLGWWELWVLVAWTVVGVCAMVVVKMFFHIFSSSRYSPQPGWVEGFTVSAG